MTLHFRRITDARRYLTGNGYRFQNYGKLTRTNEMYLAPGMVAMISKVPFAGYRVTIKPAAGRDAKPGVMS